MTNENNSKPKPANKSKTTANNKLKWSRKRYPIGTWRMPYGEKSTGYAEVRDARGDMVPGTGRAKGPSH